MQKKCDLYLSMPVRSERLKFIQIFDKEFLYDAEKTYGGYLKINVDRIKLISVICDLRAHKINCFSVPIEYRDCTNISENQAFVLAKNYANGIGASVYDAIQFQSMCPPVHWIFGLKYSSATEEKVGGVVMIDRLDGHAWTNSEREEYMYDYNNVL